MLSCRFRVVAAVLCAVCFCQPALADDARAYLQQGMTNPAERRILVEEGKKASTFCFNCHGDNGNSTLPDVPNLAEQHPVYLLDQIDAFLSGRRRDDFMEGLMRVLTPREKAAVAMFFAQAKVVPASPTPGPRAEQGKVFFAKICAQCHNANATGGESYPRLAGQQPEYIRVSLKRYLTMSNERFSPQMTNAARQLGEQNIEAIVDYLSSLKTN